MEGRAELVESVREYYGKMLKGTKDLKTNGSTYGSGGCC